MSEKADPIVAHVLYVAEQHHPWRLASIERLAVQYHTDTTVFLDFGIIDLSVQPQAGRKGVSKQHYHVWCLADDAAWERVQAERIAFQATLDALAAALRQLGRYSDRLAEAGGEARAPNPLTPSVICAPDPDVTPKNWFTTRPVPQLTRRVVISHTWKMLRCQSSYHPETEVPHHQRDHVVCPTDADWEHIQTLHQAALDAEQRWNALLSELGTYRDALADQRYADRVVAPAVSEVVLNVPPRPSWPALLPPLIYGCHQNATSGTTIHIWQPAPKPRARQRHQTLCHTVMTEPPGSPDWANTNIRLCKDCRRAAEALATTPPVPAAEHAEDVAEAPLAASGGIWHTLPPKLAGYTWIGRQENAATMPTARLRAPDGWESGEYQGGNNRAIAEALRREGSEPKSTPASGELATVEPISTPGALPAPLQECARRAVAADRKGGEALLEKAAALSEARSLAKHGEWAIFLEAIGVHEREARRLIAIHERAERDARFADGIRSGWLTFSVARLVTQADDVLLGQLLTQNTPPTVRQVEAATKSDHVVRSAPPARPNAPAGWVWRDNDSLRRIADSVIVGPYARLADVVSAAEQIDRARTGCDAEHVAAVGRILREAPKWNESEQVDLYREAYAHAREVRDLERRQALFTEIDQAIDRLQAPALADAAPVPLTPAARDADGVWFWASKSAAHPTAHHWRARPTEQGHYVAACGIEVGELPTTGTDAGHCSVCERNAARRETIPLPAGAEPLVQEAPATDAERVAVLRGDLDEQRDARLIHKMEMNDIQEATDLGPRPPAIEPLAAAQDETLPAPVPIGVYAPAVTLLGAIRTALMVGQRAQALDRVLELVGVLASADEGVSCRLLELADELAGAESAELDPATYAALVTYRQARAGEGDGRGARGVFLCDLCWLISRVLEFRARPERRKPSLRAGSIPSYCGELSNLPLMSPLLFSAYAPCVLSSI